ncbi:MAG: stage V sporulation protein B [Firmicutes bacterium HGW-Firmicutes-14]|nr:MAG: stage V sporulation protein B [Firmicutes bacterium HGW-Firmicutes-14]
MGQSFIHGAFILMAASMVNRVLGFIYQAVIYRYIGPEGVGLFNSVYPVYILILVLATAGIPLGISKLVSEEKAMGNLRGCYYVLWLSVILLIFSGSLFSLLSYLFLPILLKYVFVNEMVYPVFLCLIPGIFIISVSSAFRGFFQGMMDMKPPALAQIAEQTVRVIAGVSLAALLLPQGLHMAAAGTAAATVIGEMAGLLVVLGIFFRRKPLNLRFELPDINVSLNILRYLFELCTPITLGRIVATLIISVDSVLIPLMLTKAGYTASAATALFGQFTGVALTLLFVPSVITISMATSLVPAISEACAQNRPILVSSRTGEAIRVTLLAGIPFITAFLIIPDGLCEAVFGSPQSGGMLRALAFGCIFAYLQQTTSGVLQGMGRPVIPMISIAAAGIIKAALITILAAGKGLGIMGVVYAYNAFFFISAGLNLKCLASSTGFALNPVNNILKPAWAGIIAGIVISRVYAIFYGLSGTGAGVAFSLALGFLSYLVALVLFGAVTRHDFRRISFLRKLIR